MHHRRVLRMGWGRVWGKDWAVKSHVSISMELGKC